jgi:arabinose-5-phosphate isomerase
MILHRTGGGSHLRTAPGGQKTVTIDSSNRDDLAASGDSRSHPSLVEARRVLEVEAAAIREVASRLDDNFVRAVELIHTSTGRVVTMGMGKSGIICKKISATLASTGTPSFFLHPGEAIHGDLGMIVSGDVVVAISNSGETEEIVRLIPAIKRLGAQLVSITGRPRSTLARNSDCHISSEISSEACPMGLAPTASTTACLALGDALAIALSTRKGFKEEHFALFHPGGKLGKKFLKVADLMHSGDRIPRVSAEKPMRDVIYEMSRKGFGITAVTDERDRLVGVISDGDLRRRLEAEENILALSAAECMKRNPTTISADQLASAALQKLEERKITSLFVVDEDETISGILHLHDLWGLQLF